MARDEKVVIRLMSDKKEEFQELADRLGMSMSSLGSYVIGQWIYQQKAVVQPMVENLQKSVGDTIKESLLKVVEQDDVERNV